MPRSGRFSGFRIGPSRAGRVRAEGAVRAGRRASSELAGTALDDPLHRGVIGVGELDDERAHLRMLGPGRVRDVRRLLLTAAEYGLARFTVETRDIHKVYALYGVDPAKVREATPGWLDRFLPRLGREPFREPIERLFHAAGNGAERIVLQRVGEELRVG